MSTPLEIRARRHMPPVQDDQYLIDLYLDEMIDTYRITVGYGRLLNGVTGSVEMLLRSGLFKWGGASTVVKDVDGGESLFRNF